MAVLALSVLFGARAECAGVQSIYADLAPARCGTAVVDAESGASVRRCPGIAGYSLRAESDDDRASLTVVAADGARYPLRFCDVVTPYFSRLGPRAEWRVAEQDMPHALIVRVDTIASPAATKTTSYLAVAKIAPPTTCVTDRIAPSRNANAEARPAADAAPGEACLTTFP
jgi:hypothetical protein